MIYPLCPPTLTPTRLRESPAPFSCVPSHAILCSESTHLHSNFSAASPPPLPRFARLPCLSSGDVEDLSHGKSPWDALAAQARHHARHVRRQSINPPGCPSPSPPFQNTTTTSASSAVDKCIVERYRELANQRRIRSAIATATATAATLAS
jgi:hypothetical protein